VLRFLDEMNPRARARLERTALVVLCLAFAAWPVREALFDPSRILLGIDAALVHLPWSEGPWSEALEVEGGPRPRNPDLAGEALVLYPAYRFVSESWRRGDPPLWNPFVAGGVSCVGDPRYGVFDPQVLALAGLEALGGRGLFDWGFALLAWLRIAAAGLGAYLLARRLRITRAGAALAAISFAGSGAILLGASSSASHVAFFLPWVLLGLESTRGLRPQMGIAGAALAFGLALLGGDPSAAFFVGACALGWALAIVREDRTAGARGLIGLGLGVFLASCSLIPYAEALRGSEAWSRLAPPRAWPNLFAIGMFVIAAGVALHWKAMQAREAAASLPRERAWLRDLGSGAMFALLFAGTLALVPFPLVARLALAPDLFGRAPGEYVGPGSYVHAAAPWIPLVALALALSAILSPAGRMLRRRAAIAMGAFAFLLALGAPGLVELFRHVPVAGAVSLAPLAAVSALLLSLLGGHGLANGTRPARLASAFALGLTCFVADKQAPLAAPPASALVADREDGLVAFTRLPPAELGARGGEIAGWLHPSVPAQRVSLRVQRVGADGGVESAASFESTGSIGPSAPVSSAARLAGGVPEGARWFRVRFEGAPSFPEGTLRFSLVLFGEDGERLGSRVAAFSSVRREPRWSGSTLALAGASLALVALLPLAARVWSLLAGAAACALALAQVFSFAAGQNPPVPRAEILPACKTTEVLARQLGPHRFLAEPGLLPPLTALAAGLRDAGAERERAPASWNEVLPEVRDERGNVVLDARAPGLRLAGVAMLATSRPLAAPFPAENWELVAGPEPGAPERAEVHLYRARDPLPRAFCSPRAVLPGEEGSNGGGPDPRSAVRLEPGERFEPDAPLVEASVEGLRWRNGEVRLRAALDGAGLLVLTDQYAPGWMVEVDGEGSRLLQVERAFRGVALSAGEHEVVFRYHPLSLRVGFSLAFVAGIAVLFLALSGAARMRGHWFSLR